MTEVTDFTSALHLAAKALQFYAADHPRSVEALTNLERAAGTLLARRPRITLVAARGSLLVDGSQLAETASNRTHLKALAQELEARGFGGVIVMQGVGYRELAELVRLFVMRPQQLREAGGADEIFRRAGVIHVRISTVRYEAITEDEEVVSAQTARRADQLPATGEALPSLLRRFLLKMSGDAGESDAGMSDALAVSLRADEVSEEMPARVRDLLREAIDGIEPEVQLALLMNIAALPAGRLREALQPAARDLLGGGAAATDADALVRLLGGSSLDAAGIEQLRAQLEELGISREQLDDVIGVIGWDRLPTDERIEKLLAGTQIFDLPREKLLLFIRELLEARRHDDVLRLLETYARGIEHEAFVLRQNVADTFGEVAALTETARVTPQIEQLLMRVILNHFVKETDAKMQTTVADAVANLITALASSGRADAALRSMSRLESAISVADRDAAVRHAYESLGHAFAEPTRASKFIAQIYSADPEALNKSVLPLVAQLGAWLMPALIEALSTEDDRNRRGRLVKALKAIGRPAHPFLLEALDASAWYVVRNALLILSEIGEREHVAAIGSKLQHGDARVRRTAARALSKIGGAEAELFIVGAIGDRDPETENEVLLCLGAMKAQSAVPALCELAKARYIASEIRELVVTTLGQIGSDAAVPVLGEILRPRGLFVREPLPIRLAAARSLASIATPGARQLLRNAVAAEGDRSAREAFAKIAAM